MRKLAGIVGIAGAALLAGSCGGGGPAAPIERQTFEDAMVQLRRAAKGTDSTAFAGRRAEILGSLVLTDSLLHAFVAAHAADPEYMASVWSAIDERVNGPPEGVGSDTLSRR